MHQVLDGVSIQFPRGVNVGVLGKNGAGKSTLLRIIGGVEPPDTGMVRRELRVSWPIGFSGGFAGSLSGEENCRFVARIYGESPDRVVAFARDFAEIGKYFEMPVKTYSQGMKARLAFGLSMAIDFEVYLVDEVTAVGDEDFRRKSRAMFLERSNRSSLIIVSHSLRTIREYCKCCAVLKNGRVQLFDSVREARQAYQA
jgi:capsular polysaccharide transport system ATP-binding protein